MVLKAMNFTPKVLLSAPRRSPGVPNPAGTQVLYTVSTYSFETHSKTNELRVLDINSGESTRLAKDEIESINWLDDDEFVCLQVEKDGSTSVFWGSVSKCLQGPIEMGKSHWRVSTIDAPASNLKVTKLGPGEYGVALSALAGRDGEIFDPAKKKPTQSTGRLYSSLYVRHWDHYEDPERKALWYGKLTKGSEGKYSLSPLTNALKGTKLECPIPPFGGTDCFDVSPTGIIFIAKDPRLDPALNTKCNVYLQKLAAWEYQASSGPLEVFVEGYEGAATSPVFSPDGQKAGFLCMRRPGYEADYNTIFTMHNLDTQSLTASRFDGGQSSESEDWWNRSPSAICYAADGQSLIAIAEDQGYGRAYQISYRKKPRAITQSGYVNEVKPLASGKVFVSSSSLIDNSLFTIVDPSVDESANTDLSVWTHSNSAAGSKFGLKPGQISSIHSPANNPKINKEIHSWVVKPSDFDSSQKYPVAYLIHGGPQGSWGDNWSTRWNPAVFAEQGFIVIAPNITGSTGYGQEFTDAINQNWGGDPYEDIVQVFSWVSSHLPEADNTRAVALGASYGGYMMNWIQGHPLGRKFRALVCHDGIFSTANMLATEELYFPFHDLGGAPWTRHEQQQGKGSHAFNASSVSQWRKQDPAEHLSAWRTPELVIHNSKDYRICISDGLAAFNVLQARGVESQFLTFPDENHFVLKPENSLVWHKVVLNWIRKYAGMEPFADEDEGGETFFGGVREGGEEAVEMAGQGKPET